MSSHNTLVHKQSKQIVGYPRKINPLKFPFHDVRPILRSYETNSMKPTVGNGKVLAVKSDTHSIKTKFEMSR